MPEPHTIAPLLRVRDVSITHEGNAGPSPAHVSFEIGAGEVALLLGPSGSGKSTLGLALNGLIPHDIPADVTGTIEVQGLDTKTATPAQLSPHVAMVFQDPDAQLVTGTVLDEVCFGTENLLLPVDEILRRAEWALRKVGLWTRRADNPDSLSGGGRQRLAIACALAMGAPLLVLDEPTANLDPAGVEEVYAVLAEIVRDHDRSILLIEHNLDEAMALATRLIVLDEAGHVAFDGKPRTVLQVHSETLASLGVWLPTPTLTGLQLRAAGHDVDVAPTTAAELREALPAARRTLTAPSESAGTAPAVEVSHLTITHDGRRVLDDVSLTIPQGSFTAIVGGNGAGKTTLVQAIAGVVRPPKRTVSFGSIDPATANGKKLAHAVGFVFQNPEHQFIAQTVYDELAISLRGDQLSNDDVRARVNDVLDRFGLRDRAESHPFLLSGGQKRRLSVGTALMSAAPVIVLDEPTFGQDRSRARELLDLLHDLNAQGTTIIIVTHDMQLVADDATHVIALDGGTVAAAGTVRDVFRDDDLVHRVGLRIPALPRAVRTVAGYEDVWSSRDFGHVVGDGS